MMIAFAISSFIKQVSWMHTWSLVKYTLLFKKIQLICFVFSKNTYLHCLQICFILRYYSIICKYDYTAKYVISVII